MEAGPAASGGAGRAGAKTPHHRLEPALRFGESFVLDEMGAIRRRPATDHTGPAVPGLGGGGGSGSSDNSAERVSRHDTDGAMPAGDVPTQPCNGRHALDCGACPHPQMQITSPLRRAVPLPPLQCTFTYGGCAGWTPASGVTTRRRWRGSVIGHHFAGLIEFATFPRRVATGARPSHAVHVPLIPLNNLRDYLDGDAFTDEPERQLGGCRVHSAPFTGGHRGKRKHHGHHHHRRLSHHRRRQQSRVPHCWLLASASTNQPRLPPRAALKELAERMGDSEGGMVEIPAFIGTAFSQHWEHALVEAADDVFADPEPLLSPENEQPLCVYFNQPTNQPTPSPFSLPLPRRFPTASSPHRPRPVMWLVWSNGIFSVSCLF